MPRGQRLILGCGFGNVTVKPDMRMRPELAQGQEAMRPELVQPCVQLADYTTLRVGGPARRMITVDTESELVQTVRSLDERGEPLLILGGGSNLLVGDAGFDGTVIKIDTGGIDEDTAACSGAVITVAAGEPWDPLVSYAIERGWSGMEAMSGIPGLVGATQIQNVGA